MRRYSTNKHSQCCYCSSDFETITWTKNNVSEDIRIQYFSNRLSGGQREPVRHVCELCNIQFRLHKLTYPGECPGRVVKFKTRGENREFATYYLHLFPYSFYPDLFLRALRVGLHRLRRVNVEVQYFDAEKSLYTLREDETVLQGFIPTPKPEKGGARQAGIILPKFSMTEGNVLLFPINSIGKNESERFLYAVEVAILIHQFMGCKVLLTDSPVNILEKSDFADLYIDNLLMLRNHNHLVLI